MKLNKFYLSLFNQWMLQREFCDVGEEHLTSWSPSNFCEISITPKGDFTSKHKLFSTILFLYSCWKLLAEGEFQEHLYRSRNTVEELTSLIH